MLPRTTVSVATASRGHEHAHMRSRAAENVVRLGKTRDQSTSFRAGKVIFEVNEYEAYEAQRWLVGDVQ